MTVSCLKRKFLSIRTENNSTKVAKGRLVLTVLFLRREKNEECKCPYVRHMFPHKLKLKLFVAILARNVSLTTQFFDVLAHILTQDFSTAR